MTRNLLLLCLAACIARGAGVEANSSRGREFFETLACVQCHSVDGKGGKIGPDLGRRIDRNFTPASLAATMWNHAPVMWVSMKDQQIRGSEMTESAAADLFAYFYAERFFEKPGDAGRGKRAFAAKHCADCHALTAGGIAGAKLPAAKPVSEWTSIGHPMELANAMWGHGATMREEFQNRKLARPELTPQDLGDILVYIRNLPGMRDRVSYFAITSGARGEALFQSKGCNGCHAGLLALPPLLRGKTVTDIAAAMWNHQTQMAKQPATFTGEEMNDMVSYLWAEQFFEDAGNAAAGRKVFIGKKCAGCHEDPASGAPKPGSDGRAYNGATMLSVLWRHGPKMLDSMNAKGMAWPRFNRSQMSDLIAYLNSTKGKR